MSAAQNLCSQFIQVWIIESTRTAFKLLHSILPKKIELFDFSPFGICTGKYLCRSYCKMDSYKI